MSSTTCFSRAMRGWLAACAAATATICAFTSFIVATSSGSLSFRPVGTSLPGLLSVAALIFAVTLVLTGISAAVAIWLSERFRIRHVLFFGCTGAVTGALGQMALLALFKPWPPSFSPLYAVAGFAAGLTYWYVAGRHAGSDRHLPGESR